MAEAIEVIPAKSGQRSINVLYLAVFSRDTTWAWARVPTIACVLADLALKATKDHGVDFAAINAERCGNLGCLLARPGYYFLKTGGQDRPLFSRVQVSIS